MCCIGTLNILNTQSFLFYKPDVILKSRGPLFVHNIDLKHLMKHYYSQNLGRDQMSNLARLESQCGGSVSHQPGIFLMSGEFASYLVYEYITALFYSKGLQGAPLFSSILFPGSTAECSSNPIHVSTALSVASNPNTRLSLSLNTWQL